MSPSTDAGSIAVSVITGAPVITVAAEATVHEAADILTDQSVGALVVGATDRPTGIVSERDLVAALADRADPGTTRVADIVSTALVWCDASASVAETAALMMDRYVRHVLVEEDGKLIGIVSARDLLGTYLSAEEPTGEAP